MNWDYRMIIWLCLMLAIVFSLLACLVWRRRLRVIEVRVRDKYDKVSQRR